MNELIRVQKDIIGGDEGKGSVRSRTMVRDYDFKSKRQRVGR